MPRRCVVVVPLPFGRFEPSQVWDIHPAGATSRADSAGRSSSLLLCLLQKAGRRSPRLFSFQGPCAAGAGGVAVVRFPSRFSSRPVGSPTQTASGTVEQATHRRGWNSRAEGRGVGDSSVSGRCARKSRAHVSSASASVGLGRPASTKRLGAGDQPPGEFAAPRERCQEASTWPACVLELRATAPRFARAPAGARGRVDECSQGRGTVPRFCRAPVRTTAPLYECSRASATVPRVSRKTPVATGSPREGCSPSRASRSRLVVTRWRSAMSISFPVRLGRGVSVV